MYVCLCMYVYVVGKVHSSYGLEISIPRTSLVTASRPEPLIISFQPKHLSLSAVNGDSVCSGTHTVISEKTQLPKYALLPACLFTLLVQAKGKEQNKEQEYRAYIRGYTRRQWCGTWCAMLRHNLSACARDTSEGVRRPRFSNAARSGPYPPLDPAGGPLADGRSCRPSSNAIGTVNTPVVVLSERMD